MKCPAAVTVLITAVLTFAGCGGSGNGKQADDQLARMALASDILRPQPLHPNPYDTHLDSMPDGTRKMHINYLGATLGRVFNDSNRLHLDAARSTGIGPLHSPFDAFRPDIPLVHIESNQNYVIDDLTHSYPYLVKNAALLLDDIGRGFRDSLASRGGGAYRIKVTSILRTPGSVKALRRRNRNAVEESTHLYGTTFDISYAKFICDDDSLPRSQEDLKNLLGEVLYDLKRLNRCYIKYERKQACFHITARP